MEANTITAILHVDLHQTHILVNKSHFYSHIDRVENENNHEYDIACLVLYDDYVIQCVLCVYRSIVIDSASSLWLILRYHFTSSI